MMESDLRAAPPRWPDIAGRLEGARHSLPLRAYFEDTDAGGLVYHASYIRWCERGRSDFLRLLGLNHNAMMAQENAAGPMAFVVRRLTIDYLKPARLDDLLEVATQSMAIGASSLTLRQEISREGAVICRAEVVCVLISLSGKPLRLKSALPPRAVAFFEAAHADTAG